MVIILYILAGFSVFGLIRSDEIKLLGRTTVSALVLAPAGDTAPKPASDIVVDNTESGDQAVCDAFNDWISGRKTAGEAHKNSINLYLCMRKTVAISHCPGESCSVLLWDSCAVVVD